MNNTRVWYMTPSVVMWVVILMYAMKVFGKLMLGYQLDVVAVYGDGWHNVSDIAEAIAVLFVLRLSKLKSDRYSNGRGNYESLFMFLQGGALAYVCLVVFGDSVTGLYTWYTNNTATQIDFVVFVWLIALYALSAVTSFLVSKYQIAVGKLHNRPLVVADGEETKSDGWVEVGVFAGLVSMIVFENMIGGYIAGLVVSYKIATTSFELLKDGKDALMQHTIGLEHDRAIRQLFLDTPGVFGVNECRTWRVGGLVQVVMKVKVDKKVGGIAERDLKWAVGDLIRVYLEEHDMPDSELHIRFDPGKPDDVRIAYAVKDSKVTSPSLATHLRLCDIQYGKITKISDESIVDEGLSALIVRKKVQKIVGWTLPEKEPLSGELPCAYEAAITPCAPDQVE